MPTIPQRIGSAFAVLRGRYGDLTKLAQDREQSRQSLYREAEKVVTAVNGAEVQAQIEELQRQLAEQRIRSRGIKLQSLASWFCAYHDPVRAIGCLRSNGEVRLSALGSLRAYHFPRSWSAFASLP